MVKIKSELRKNKSSRINGELVSANEFGEVEVSGEMASLLLSEKYSFMGWQEGGEEIKKVEIPEPLEVEKGEPIKTPEPEAPKTPQEEIEELENEVSLEDIIKEAMEDSEGGFNRLKEIAKELELPEDEWSGQKRRDYFGKYILSKLNEDEEIED